MAFFLFDTSALVKRYHVEVGSDKVDDRSRSRESVTLNYP